MERSPDRLARPADPLMNICMLTKAMPSHFKGGVQDHTLMLATGLGQSGHLVTIFTTAHADGRSEEHSGNLHIRYLAGTTPGKLDSAWYSVSIATVKELNRHSPIDIIHAQGSSGYSVVASDAPAKYTTIVSQHGTSWDELVTRTLRGFSFNPYRTVKNTATLAYVSKNLLLRDIPYLRNADGVIATSNEQARILGDIYGVGQDRLFKVFNGMDLRLFTPLPSGETVPVIPGIPEASHIILCVARLIRDKGIQHILAAYPAVLRACPGCRLVIVGDGNYRGALEEQSRNLGVADQTHFVGSIAFEQLPDYFRRCDLFVNPTVQQNGYDLTMVEAMACERVVVSSNIGSTPTLIEDGVDGVLFETANERQLSAKIIEFIRDPGLRNQIGLRARRKVLSGFTLESMVRGTEHVYETLLTRRHSSTGVAR